MQFGLLYEMQRPYDDEIDWYSLYQETLAQCELADQVGFDNLWFVEHHFLYGFSGSPCPEVMFGRCRSAPRTSASASACPSCPTITPSASPSGPRWWTSSPAAGWSSALAAPTPMSSWARALTPARPATAGTKPSG